ncbi:hypothetical protein PLESTB_001149200 [Pleodorina starrii]|uniref:Cyclic nucleotide-binding domain-containing protein n=1 Tax=Pleodorina starrii TaxID=330485 RepID=A0A9W6F5V5_9CHLO|nr:hypothetical protein PLESTM_001013800 [Pleodorina starrii]GLC56791.1 hypothetical protein PLESTB_001149200 [Pleodorina starrii]GLC68130.1 hypothetical protein PLESTF_000651400 [Pleodorina starrii]
MKPVRHRSETEKLSAADSLPKRASVLPEATQSGEVGGLAPTTSREIRLGNVRAKLKALSSSGKSLRAFDAFTDLIAEASLNKASLLDARRAPSELVKLLSLPTGQRRAVTYRDLCELGRHLHLPSWHGSERRHMYVWYHCLARLRLTEVEAGAQLMGQGEQGENCYWLLTGTMDEIRIGPPPSPPKTPLKSKLSTAISFRDVATSTGDGSSSVGGHPGTPPPGTPPLAPKPHVKKVKPFERLGQEALQNMPYTLTAEATSPCQLACLSRTDYQAVVALAARESFEGLRAMASLLANKTNRHPKALSDLSSLLSVTEMFRSMDPEFASELCGLLEFLALPEGTTVFEEGDKVDFTYLILKGEVVLSRYIESRNMSEDFAVKITGQQFGSLSALQVGAAAAAAAGGGGAGAVAAAASGSAADKKRNFSARCTQLTEFAIVTKVAYTRLLRNQLQKSLNTRLKLLQGMAIMSHSANQSALTRIAINCQDETFSAGSVLVDPACPPTRLFFIVEGQAKMLWVADSLGQAPPSSDRPMDAPYGGSGSMSGAASSIAADGNGMAALTRDGRSIKRRQQPYVYELALLSRGDVVNGMVLHGKTTHFTAVAATNLKVMSLEVAGGHVALEHLFGKEQAAMLRELVLLQAEVHRERAAHMVAVRQSSVALMDHRVGSSLTAAAASPHAAESATFLQHYVPKTPGLEASSAAPHLPAYAALLSRPSLFVPGAVQHGDVMKLVAAAGKTVLDNLAPPPAGATVPPPLRRGGGGGGTSSASAASLSSPSPPSKQSSRDRPGARDPQQQHQQQHHPQQQQGPAGLSVNQQPLQQQQQQAAVQAPGRGPMLLDMAAATAIPAAAAAAAAPQHVTTVVAQPVAVPRTRMRVPSPGMARELGLDVPPPLQPMTLQSNSSPNLSLGGGPSLMGFGDWGLDRVSSLGQLPDPAGAKSRNGRPRAPQRTQLGLPFAGNVAMLVLENHSDLVKVVTPSASSLNCVATLRHVPTNMSYCDDDGQLEDESYDIGPSDGSYDSAGHSVTVFSAEPAMARSPPRTTSVPASSPSLHLSSAAVSVPQTPLLGQNLPYARGGPISPRPGALPPAPAGEWSASSSSSRRTAGRTDGAAEDREGGPRTPFSSMPMALVAIDSDLYVSHSRGGGGSGLYGTSSGSSGDQEPGNHTSTGSAATSGVAGGGSAGDGEPPLRAPYDAIPMSQSSYTLSQTGGGRPYVAPLTMAASQSALQLGQSASSSLAAGGGGAAAAAPSQATMPSARAAAAMLGTSAIPLAAGQVHVPLASVYRRMAPAPGASGTAGAMPTPVLAATAVVQPAVSAETAKLCSSRLTTIMSTGPLASAPAGNATEAAAAAANAAVAAAGAAAVPPTSASPPPSTSSSYTRDYGNQMMRLDRSGSYVVHYVGSSGGGDRDTSPPASLSVAAAAPDSVVIMPRMVAYESALLNATVGGGGGGGRLGSPQGGAVRLASLGPAAASAAAAAAAASAMVSATPGAHATYVLPALTATSASGGSEATGGAFVTGHGGAPPSDAHSRLRPPPRMIRSLDTAVPYGTQYGNGGTSRELLGYFSSNPRMATDSEDGGMVLFPGGIGGRPVRYGSGGPGGPRRQGGGGGGGGTPRLGGVSLRDLAGVNGVPRDGAARGANARGAPAQKAPEGPDLPLELDTEAPPLQNRKLSEPSLDDLKYILTRWSKKWSQERNVAPSRGGEGVLARGNPLAASYPMPYPVSEPGTPMELSRYGYTSDDLYRIAKEQAEAAGVGAFKRPLTQLDLFGLPYIGGTPRTNVATPAGGGGGADGGGGGGGGQEAANRSQRRGG